MLSGTTLDAEDVVCTLPPGNGIVTVQKIAANCVMAGCEPEHLPVVIAACRAISSMEPFEVRGCDVDVSGRALIVVNGPIRNEIGLNYRRATLGPGKMSKVNVTIGRAFTLTLKNGVTGIRECWTWTQSGRRGSSVFASPRTRKIRLGTRST